MFSSFSLLCLFGLFVTLAQAAKNPPVYPLPPYLKRACSRNDPKINECVVEVGAPAIKAVTKGDSKYKIPKLDPLLIEELRVQQGTKQVGLELLCKNCLMWGLQNTNFYKAKVDWKKRTCEWFFTLDNLKITGKYNVSGQVLLLPIVGNGDAEFALKNLNFTFLYDWTYEKRNGYTYVNIGNSSFPFDVQHMTIKLENLFNGDKLLGGNMNRFLNEHWQEILKDLKPALSKSLAVLTKTILTNMASFIPFDIMFPDN